MTSICHLYDQADELDIDEPDTDDGDHDPDDDDTCPNCAGSGEGQYEGETCFVCKGRGTK